MIHHLKFYCHNLLHFNHNLTLNFQLYLHWFLISWSNIVCSTVLVVLTYLISLGSTLTLSNTWWLTLCFWRDSNTAAIIGRLASCEGNILYLVICSIKGYACKTGTGSNLQTTGINTPEVVLRFTHRGYQTPL